MQRWNLVGRRQWSPSTTFAHGWTVLQQYQPKRESIRVGFPHVQTLAEKKKKEDNKHLEEESKDIFKSIISSTTPLLSYELNLGKVNTGSLDNVHGFCCDP